MIISSRLSKTFLSPLFQEKVKLKKIQLLREHRHLILRLPKTEKKNNLTMKQRMISSIYCRDLEHIVPRDNSIVPTGVIIPAGP